MQNKILVALIIIILVIIGIVVSNRNSTDILDENAQLEDSDLMLGDPLSGGLVAGAASSDLAGVWVNDSIPKYKIELSADGLAREYYGGGQTNSGSWYVDDSGLNITFGGKTYKYGLTSVSSDAFSARYAGSEKNLSFSRVK